MYMQDFTTNHSFGYMEGVYMFTYVNMKKSFWSQLYVYYATLSYRTMQQMK